MDGVEVILVLMHCERVAAAKNIGNDPFKVRSFKGHIRRL